MFEEMRTSGGLSLQATCCGPDCSPSLADAQVNRPMDFERLEQSQRSKLERQLADGTCIVWG